MKFKALDKINPIVKLIKECKITFYYYPINNYIKGKRYYFLAVGFIEGEEVDKNNFLKKLKKLKSNIRKIDNFEHEKDFFVELTSETITANSKKLISIFYNPTIVHLKPAIIYPNGWEEQEIACFDRKVMEKIIDVGQKLYSLKLLYFKKSKISNIGILNVLPKLTDKQKNALRLAIKKGYYEYPRKIDVQNLAKIAKLSFSTFQEHLRKAEKKIIPFSAKVL